MTLNPKRQILYSVKGLPREDFDNADRLVRAVHLAGKGRIDGRRPRVVTDDGENMDVTEKRYVRKHKENLDAVCFQSHRSTELFHLYFNPKVDTQSDYFHGHMLVHELCHGYYAPARGHDRIWKLFASRAVYHYHWLVHSIPTYEDFIYFNYHHYTKQTKSEDEFDVQLRVRQDVDRVLESSAEELSKVMSIYEALT